MHYAVCCADQIVQITGSRRCVHGKGSGSRIKPDITRAAQRTVVSNRAGGQEGGARGTESCESGSKSARQQRAQLKKIGSVHVELT
eukprot:scaffold14030_cov121-Isochrysis_galbana.AAC.6